MQLHSSLLNVLVQLEGEVGLGRHSRHVCVLRSELQVQLAELIVPLVQLPLASPAAYMHDVVNYVFAVYVAPLVLWKFDLTSLRIVTTHLEFFYLA